MKLFQTIILFSRLQGDQYGKAFGKLLAAGFGGASLGAMGGLLTALLTRVTRKCRGRYSCV